MNDRPEMMMSVSDEDATRRFFVEALKANTETMKAMREDIREEREERKEDRRLLHDIKDRVVKIESNRLDSSVAALKTDVDILKRDKDRRDGAVSGFDWLLKSPLLGWLIGAAAAAYAIITARGQG